MMPINRTLIVALVSSLLMAGVFETEAQQPQKIPKVGFLWIGSPGSPSPLILAFEKGLRDLGWVKGQNVAVEYRYAEGKAERFPDLAAELVRLPVEVIVAPPAPATLAAKAATTTIPIVFTLGADPVAFGVLASIRPQGGNITGLTEVAPELTPKRLTVESPPLRALDDRFAILDQEAPAHVRDHRMKRKHRQNLGYLPSEFR